MFSNQLHDAVTVSNSWKPSMEYSLSAVLSHSGFGSSQEHTQEVSTQKDPPLSQFNIDAFAPAVVEAPPAPPKPWARLICKAPDLPSYDLMDVPPDEEGRHNLYWIGRGSSCNPRLLTSPRISNKHCIIYCRPNKAKIDNSYLEAWIEDLSANGTYLNKDIRLQKNVPRLLRSGDEIHFINPTLVNTPNMNVTNEDLVRNTYLVVIDLPKPNLGNTRTLRSSTLTKELQQIIGRSTTVATLLDQNRNFFHFYELREQLGEGGYGAVYVGVDKATGRDWAVKLIDIRRLAMANDLDSITREAHMLRSLRHPNIIRLEDIFAQNSQLYLVMELAHGGDLFDRITSKGRYSEDEAKKVMLPILEAIRYMHDHNVAHRDLKPENILLVNRDDDFNIKLTDFGLAKVADDSNKLKTFCGTPQYYSPEVLELRNSSNSQGRRSRIYYCVFMCYCGVNFCLFGPVRLGSYTLAADMWSIGVILYVLLSGAYPFDEQFVDQQIRTASYSFDKSKPPLPPLPSHSH